MEDASKPSNHFRDIFHLLGGTHAVEQQSNMLICLTVLVPSGTTEFSQYVSSLNSKLQNLRYSHGAGTLFIARLPSGR